MRRFRRSLLIVSSGGPALAHPGDALANNQVRARDCRSRARDDFARNSARLARVLDLNRGLRGRITARSDRPFGVHTPPRSEHTLMRQLSGPADRGVRKGIPTLRALRVRVTRNPARASLTTPPAAASSFRGNFGTGTTSFAQADRDGLLAARNFSAGAARPERTARALVHRAPDLALRLLAVLRHARLLEATSARQMPSKG